MYSKVQNRIDIFSTSPQSKNFNRGEYLKEVINVAKWSEDFGCTGILVYTDNGIADPWLVSQVIVQNTSHISPLVAVQPIYMLPYTAAKMISTIGLLHERRLFLNMLAGGFKNDLIALNDDTPHDERYERTIEYSLIIKRLLESSSPVSFEGKYYTIRNLTMAPALPEALQPGLLISGSSDASMAAAKAIGATAIKYPKAPGEERGVPHDSPVACGVRVGIIARRDVEEAWRVARQRFPDDRKGQLTHQLAMKVSDSQWHKQLSEPEHAEVDMETPYWLGPFQNYKTFCPYLVGSYDRVAREIRSYIDNGYRSFILDIPPSYEELEHTGIVFDKAKETLDA